MKKQIFILTMLTLAFLFAGVKSYGQDPDHLEFPTGVNAAECAPVTTLNCADDDHLHPIPGKPYEYTVGIPNGDAASVHWFVVNATANPNLIDNGGYTFAHASGLAEPTGGQYLLSADTHYNTTASTLPNDLTIEISWQSFNAATTDILLVAYVVGDECADNIEAWKIEPVFAFTLDVASVMPNGSLNYEGKPNAFECVSPVQSAVYNPGASPTITMDYGENYVFFSVTAANFVHSWKPTMTAVHSGGSATTVTWAYAADAGSSVAANWHAADDPVMAASGAVGGTGECIVVRVLVDHGTVENAVASTVELTVDGIMYNVTTNAYPNTGQGFDDLDNPESGDDCVVGSFDKAVYDLTPRPKIEAVTPTPFVDKPQP